MSAAEMESQQLRIVDVTDERAPLARRAISLIQDAIWDVHPTRFLLAELEESRRGEAKGGRYHLLAVGDGDSQTPVAAAAGAYLADVNAGFVAYLAVHEDHRSGGLGQRLRERLVDAFRHEALATHGEDLSAVLGEVESDSPWLRRLVQSGRAVPFDTPYFHPWMSRGSEGHYTLYREPVADPRRVLPAHEIAELIEAVWRRAYRVRDPYRSEIFRYMMHRLHERAEEEDLSEAGVPA